MYIYIYMYSNLNIFCMDTQNAEKLAMSGCLDRTAELSEIVLLKLC